MSYLLDTNVISELRKGQRCDRGVAAWFADLAPEDIYLSVLTVGEIRKGIERIRRRDPRSAEALESWLLDLLDAFSNRILPVGQAEAQEWGRLNVPDPLPVIDSYLAATAKIHGLTLATRNVEDVVRTEVDVVNPFTQ